MNRIQIQKRFLVAVMLMMGILASTAHAGRGHTDQWHDRGRHYDAGERWITLDRSIGRIHRIQDRLGTLRGRRIEEARWHLMQARRLLKKARRVRMRNHKPYEFYRRPAHLFDFTKKNNRPELLRADISEHTRHRGFDTLDVDVTAGRRHTIIVNTVKVKHHGRWREHTIGRRLAAGKNPLKVPIPAGAENIRISIDHGAGSLVAVSMR